MYLCFAEQKIENNAPVFQNQFIAKVNWRKTNSHEFVSHGRISVWKKQQHPQKWFLYHSVLLIMILLIVLSVGWTPIYRLKFISNHILQREFLSFARSYCFFPLNVHDKHWCEASDIPIYLYLVVRSLIQKSVFQLFQWKGINAS